MAIPLDKVRRRTSDHTLAPRHIRQTISLSVGEGMEADHGAGDLDRVSDVAETTDLALRSWVFIIDFNRPPICDGTICFLLQNQRPVSLMHIGPCCRGAAVLATVMSTPKTAAILISRSLVLVVF